MIRKHAPSMTLCVAFLGAILVSPARAQNGPAVAPPAFSRVPASLLPGGSRANPTLASLPASPDGAAIEPADAGPSAGSSAMTLVPGTGGTDAPEGRPAGGPGGLASTGAPERYQVGPGDVLRVTVWQEPDASGDFKVSPQGTIQHFLLGQVGVSGHTIAEIGEVLRGSLASGFLRDPKVEVRVEEYHAQKAFVYGQVARPGTYELRGETDVLRVLLDAGGPTPLAGDDVSLLHILKTSKGEEVRSQTISLERILTRGDLTQNAPVTNGDVIFVPGKDESARGTSAPDARAYYVLGEVKNPGSYRFRDGATAMTAILEAGGFSEFARPNKTKLVREKGAARETKILKMGEMMEKGDRSMDVKLGPGDVLVVPKSLF